MGRMWRRVKVEEGKGEERREEEGRRGREYGLKSGRERRGRESRDTGREGD